MIGDAAQPISEPGLGVDAVEFGPDNQVDTTARTAEIVVDDLDRSPAELPSPIGEPV